MFEKFKNNLIPKEIWIVIFSIFSSLTITAFYYKNINITLTSFHDRTIGIVVLNGVDAAARTSAYVKLIFLFSLVFLSINFFLNYLNKKIIIKAYKTSVEKKQILYLSSFSIFSIFLFFITRNNIYISILKIQAILLFLFFFIILIKLTFRSYQKFYSNYYMLFLCLCISIS
ncbi:hypothetical protein, partial [Paenibacillus solanacearum]|uniref:hypothetical protein n=1 Tax=Paenibacillus solanacearum TaxID=2048548 RepID=UPI001C4057CE